jgi:hypothetical protein
VFRFEAKWIPSSVPGTGELLTDDIQGMADLGNSYSAVRRMRIVPFALEDVTFLAATTVLPLLPLVLTRFSPEQVLVGLVKILFR